MGFVLGAEREAGSHERYSNDEMTGSAQNLTRLFHSKPVFGVADRVNQLDPPSIIWQLNNRQVSVLSRDPVFCRDIAGAAVSAVTYVAVVESLPDTLVPGRVMRTAC